MIAVGQRFAASVKFGLPFAVIGFHPVKPLAQIKMEGIGTRFVPVRSLQHSIVCGTIREVGTGVASTKNFAATLNSGCKPVADVVSCFYGGARLSGPQTTANNGQSAGENIMDNTQTVPFVKMQNASGKYTIFQLPGHGARIYIASKLFPDGKVPESIEISGLVAAGSDVDSVTREQERAAKAQAKAEKAQAQAQVKVERAKAIAVKAQAAAEAALARAAKAAAAAGTVVASPAAAPEGTNQPNL